VLSPATVTPANNSAAGLGRSAHRGAGVALREPATRGSAGICKAAWSPVWSVVSALGSRPGPASRSMRERWRPAAVAHSGRPPACLACRR